MYRSFRPRVVIKKLPEKTSALIFLVLIFFYSLQQIYSQSYLGAYIISDSIAVPYYLSFNKDSGVGYSVSGIFTESETFSLVSFSEKSNNLINFKEEATIFTKLRPDLYSDFCELRYSISKKQLNKSEISSQYEAVLSNGILCGRGKIQLESIFNLKNKLDKINYKLENNIFLKSLSSKENRQITTKKLNEIKNKLTDNYSKEVNLKDLDFIDFIGLRNEREINIHFELLNNKILEDMFSFENSRFFFSDNKVSIRRIISNKPITLKINQFINQKLFFKISEINKLDIKFQISEGDKHVFLQF